MYRTRRYAVSIIGTIIIQVIRDIRDIRERPPSRETPIDSYSKLKARIIKNQI